MYELPVMKLCKLCRVLCMKSKCLCMKRHTCLNHIIEFRVHIWWFFFILSHILTWCLSHPSLCIRDITAWVKSRLNFSLSFSSFTAAMFWKLSWIKQTDSDQTDFACDDDTTVSEVCVCPCVCVLHHLIPNVWNTNITFTFRHLADVFIQNDLQRLGNN